jgi:hypothetical protein
VETLFLLISSTEGADSTVSDVWRSSFGPTARRGELSTKDVSIFDFGLNHAPVICEWSILLRILEHVFTYIVDV